MLFVVDQRKRVGIVKRGVTDFVLIEAKIMVQKNTDLAAIFSGVSDSYPAKVDVFAAGDGVVTNYLDAEPWALEVNVGNERIGNIFERPVPRIGIHPRKLSVGPHAKAKRKTFGMILLPDVREINIADLIFVVEINEQTAISDRDVTHT